MFLNIKVINFLYMLAAKMNITNVQAFQALAELVCNYSSEKDNATIVCKPMVTGYTEHIIDYNSGCTQN